MISSAFRGAARVSGAVSLGYAIVMSMILRLNNIDATSMRLFVDGGWFYGVLAILGIILLGLSMTDE